MDHSPRTNQQNRDRFFSQASTSQSLNPFFSTGSKAKNLSKDLQYKMQKQQYRHQEPNFPQTHDTHYQSLSIIFQSLGTIK